MVGFTVVLFTVSCVSRYLDLCTRTALQYQLTPLIVSPTVQVLQPLTGTTEICRMLARRCWWASLWCYTVTCNVSSWVLNLTHWLWCWLSADKWYRRSTVISYTSLLVRCYFSFGQFWSTLNHFRTGQGRCAANLVRWNQTSDPSLYIQTMLHIVNDCPDMKFPGGLSALHLAEEEAIAWLGMLSTR